MSRDEKEIGCFVLIMLAFIIAIPLVIAGSAYMESNSYNRLTGAQTTWWDAVWLELRVQDQPK